MKALILQMRGAGDSSRAVEQQEYLEYTGLAPNQIDFADLFDQPGFPPERLLDYGLLFIGGISRDKPSELSWPAHRFPFIQNLRRLMRLAIEKKVPSLLSCGGFAIAGDMLGAKTYGKSENFELGVYPLRKTEAARRDVFLRPVSDGLNMVLGHVKYFVETPPGTELLFYTNTYADRVPVQAFKVTGAPFYAFQGHPEISCYELAERVKPMRYRRNYFPKRPGHAHDAQNGYNDEAYKAFCRLQADTSEAQGLLKRFVKLVEEGAFSPPIQSSPDRETEM